MVVTAISARAEGTIPWGDRGLLITAVAWISRLVQVPLGGRPNLQT
jgi:hypothetical protein